jgi:hypothetical protein
MATERMTIRDLRLLGNAPNLTFNTFSVDQNWDLGAAFLWVKNFATMSKRLDTLFVLCHGLYQWEENAQLQASIPVGGYGLQICKQNLTLGNVDVVGNLVRGLIDNIVLFACGSASTQSNNAAQRNQSFCKKLANKTGAVVYGADRMQVYTPGLDVQKPMNFADWEGTVYRFDPDGVGVEVAEKNVAKTTT